MSFVYLGGDDTSRPTYFEVVAADNLVPSLKAAVVYTLSVLSQRHRWVHHLLEHDDEVITAVLFLLDWQSLSTSDATFSEALYGLKRQAQGAACTADNNPTRLTKQQRILSLLVQTVLPYICGKGERLYKLHADRGVLGLALRSQATGLHTGAQTQWPSRLRLATLRAFVAAYPWLRASLEGLNFGFQALYLLVDSSRAHRPALHALGLQLARISPQDMAESAKAKQLSRNAQLDAVRRRSSPPLALLQQMLLHARYLVADHTRNALILAVFAFKALEWWYSSAEDKLSAGKALPPPPPPAPPQPSPHGVGLPDDPSQCAVCRLADSKAMLLTAHQTLLHVSSTSARSFTKASSTSLSLTPYLPRSTQA